MSDYPRVYWSRVEGERLVIANTKGQDSGDLFTVKIPAKVPLSKDKGPWQIPCVGLEVAHGILYHYFTLFRGEEAAAVLARALRDDFVAAFISCRTGNEFDVDETQIDKWVIVNLLNDFITIRDYKRRGANVADQLN